MLRLAIFCTCCISQVLTDHAPVRRMYLHTGVEPAGSLNRLWPGQGLEALSKAVSTLSCHIFDILGCWLSLDTLDAAALPFNSSDASPLQATGDGLCSLNASRSAWPYSLFFFEASGHDKRPNDKRPGTSDATTCRGSVSSQEGRH